MSIRVAAESDPHDEHQIEFDFHSGHLLDNPAPESPVVEVHRRARRLNFGAVNLNADLAHFGCAAVAAPVARIALRPRPKLGAERVRRELG